MQHCIGRVEMSLCWPLEIAIIVLLHQQYGNKSSCLPQPFNTPITSHLYLFLCLLITPNSSPSWGKTGEGNAWEPCT